MSEFGNIFPSNYQIRTFYEISQGEILAEWLAETNRELYEEVKAYDWTARMYDHPIRIENIRFEGGRGCIMTLRTFMTS